MTVPNSTKRIVLSIIESSREVGDVWKRYQIKQSLYYRVRLYAAMNRLQKAVDRLDGMKDEAS